MQPRCRFSTPKSLQHSQIAPPYTCKTLLLPDWSSGAVLASWLFLVRSKTATNALKCSDDSAECAGSGLEWKAHAGNSAYFSRFVWIFFRPRKSSPRAEFFEKIAIKAQRSLCRGYPQEIIVCHYGYDWGIVGGIWHLLGDIDTNIALGKVAN